nr:sugar ABC transporter ATP-binding protein [uncultured Sphaerochaeta sp.]
MNNETILKLSGVNKSFAGVRALRDIDFSLKQGEIHCLAGENGSGKSTLVKIVTGVYEPDSGEIWVNGNTFTKFNPIVSMQQGIQVIYQDLALFTHMSIAENIAINKIRQSGKRLVRQQEIKEIAEKQLDRIGVSLDLDRTIQESSMGNRQITAICRALALDAKILFLDEPTTALTNHEVERLLKILVELKANGLSIIFISHKLDEVFQVSDAITILRDGVKVGDFTAKEIDRKQLVYYMTGRNINYPKYKKLKGETEQILSVKNLSGNRFSNISLDVQEGDIIGLAGLLGSGRTEFALSLFGLNPPSEGAITLGGKPYTPKSTQNAKEMGIALLPEDRLVQGLFLGKNIQENVSSSVLGKLEKSLNRIDVQTETEYADKIVKEIRVKTPSLTTLIKNLSGGNQQKAVLGKWIITGPNLFIMDSPTVGIDVGSKAEIYEIIQTLAREGMGIILISDEAEEIVVNCNKVVVFAQGKIKTILTEKDLAQEGIEHTLTHIIGNVTKNGSNGGNAYANQ